LTRPNGVNTTYSYNNVSNLLSVLHQLGTTTLDGASYTYDLAGNRKKRGWPIQARVWLEWGSFLAVPLPRDSFPASGTTARFP
jgi:YD repeat-containing protein